MRGFHIALAAMALATPVTSDGWAQARRPAHSAANARTNSAATIPGNPVNDYLVKLPVNQRAAWLARTAGKWCIGTDPFLMGVSQTGIGAGYAYWSFNCAGYGSFVLQIEPRGHGELIDCKTFKEQAAGKECFKKF